MNKDLEKDLIDLLDVDYEDLFIDDDEVLVENTAREMPGISLYRYYKDKAKKQEKLLKLYKELSNYVCEQCYAHKLPEITRLKIIIKELENETN